MCIYIDVKINFAWVMLGVKKPVKCYAWSSDVYGAKNWTPRKSDQKTWKVLKSCAGEGWRRSVGPIMWKMKE
jgi:hypothetical protein